MWLSQKWRFRTFLVLCFPFLTVAQEFAAERSSFEVIFYGAIGLFSAVSLAVFVAGFFQYITRLGTEKREEGIHTMEKAFSIMAVVFLAIVVVKYFGG